MHYYIVVQYFQSFDYIIVGQYAYIEASAPRKQGDSARLLSESLTYPTHKCMHFWYYMYGTGIGTLRIWVLQQGTTNPLPIWELSGNQPNMWNQGQIQIPTQTKGFQV